MSKYPEDCLYTKEHEWIRVNGKTGVVGITHYAQKQLGDIVFVELPKVGDHFDTNESFGTVESVKAVSEIYCPVAGEVTEINEAVVNSPETLNSDPHGDAWLIEIKIKNPPDLEDLMSAEEYDEYIHDEAAE
ncbi:MAG: glycine cleavage system protein GcvH [Acidobacteriia bacterium]|nr:glycine cleavage system protein GcvH [Terriglobia bacterium]